MFAQFHRKKILKHFFISFSFLIILITVSLLLFFFVPTYFLITLSCFFFFNYLFLTFLSLHLSLSLPRCLFLSHFLFLIFFLSTSLLLFFPNRSLCRSPESFIVRNKTCNDEFSQRSVFQRMKQEMHKINTNNKVLINLFKINKAV